MKHSIWQWPPSFIVSYTIKGEIPRLACELNTQLCGQPEPSCPCLSTQAVFFLHASAGLKCWVKREREKRDSIKMKVGHRKEPESLSLPEAQSFMNDSSSSVVLNLQGSGTLSKTLMKRWSVHMHVHEKRPTQGQGVYEPRMVHPLAQVKRHE